MQAIQEQPKTIQQLGTDFLYYLDVSVTTAETYKRGIYKFLHWLQEVDETHPTNDTIQNYKKKIIMENKPATAQLYLTVCKRFFDWLELRGYYRNITRGIKSIKVDRGHKKDYFTAKQVLDIITNIDISTEETARNKAILTLAFTTGTRCVELQRANRGDIRKRGGNIVLYLQGKGRAEKAIRCYLSFRTDEDDDSPLFTSTSDRNKGQRLTTHSISRIMKQSFINAGFNSSRLTAHSTRHTAFSLALLNGESLTDVQTMARHSNSDTTRIYIGDIERDNNTCSKTVADAIFNNKNNCMTIN